MSMHTSNGTHTTNGRAATTPAASEANQLKIFRIEPGTQYHIRTLTDHYGGLFTHWLRGRSVYCAGDECNPAVHRNGRIWKGYAAVEVFQLDKKRWRPTVLEITELLELDFRGKYRRGQVWELWRDAQTGRKATPVQAKLTEERDPAKFPDPFDVRAPLMHLFHLQHVQLDYKNPMPPRVFVADSDGDAPKCYTHERVAKEKALHEKTMAELERDREQVNRIKSLVDGIGK